jgi:hypothetical protein
MPQLVIDFSQNERGATGGLLYAISKASNFEGSIVTNSIGSGKLLSVEAHQYRKKESPDTRNTRTQNERYQARIKLFLNVAVFLFWILWGFVLQSSVLILGALVTLAALRMVLLSVFEKFACRANRTTSVDQNEPNRSVPSSQMASTDVCSCLWMQSLQRSFVFVLLRFHLPAIGLIFTSYAPGILLIQVLFTYPDFTLALWLKHEDKAVTCDVSSIPCVWKTYDSLESASLFEFHQVIFLLPLMSFIVIVLVDGVTRKCRGGRGTFARVTSDALITLTILFGWAMCKHAFDWFDW